MLTIKPLVDVPALHFFYEHDSVTASNMNPAASEQIKAHEPFDPFEERLAAANSFLKRFNSFRPSLQYCSHSDSSHSDSSIRSGSGL